jgi:putative transcription antitermination factor YqgF
MKILGIDYGRSKVGLALADGPLAEPIKVIRYKNIEALSAEIEKIIEKENVGKVVVGVSEGSMGEESKKFALDLSLITAAIIETYDETLTSHDAQALSMEAGINRKKRREMEDAYAAAIMLQNYLDSA